MLQKECVFVWWMCARSGQGRQKGGEELEHQIKVAKIPRRFLFTTQMAQFYQLTISLPFRFSVSPVHVCVCVCVRTYVC